MALQNIGASNSDDAFYRYKMPSMNTKIEGRGNGIKTKVVNMVDIAKALARPASYTTKYFGCELGAQSNFNEKTGVSLVNGSHDKHKLEGLLEKFINKYVQCYGCGNPETEVLITKTQMAQLKCAACGFISDVDMRDKLTSFILKNPPEQKKSSKDKKAADEELKKKKEVKKKGSTSSKEGPTKASITKKKASGSDEDVDEDDDDGVQWETDTSAEAARQRKEQLSSVTADMVMLTTDEPEKKPKKGENGKMTTHTKLVEKLKADLNNGIAPNELIRSLSGSSDQEVMTAFYEALFDGIEKGFAKQVIKKKKYLVAAVSEGEGSQLMLLRAMEKFCGKSNSNALKEVALVLKELYDADVLEEEYVVKWFEQGLAGENKISPIWKNAKPFVEWLQSAESETEEE